MEIKKASLKEMFGYSTGEIANSLTLNSIQAFTMIFCTAAIGLPPYLAGLIMAVSIFWDALSDPIMGFISDITKCKYGRRHPYIFIGGILLAIAFFFLWNIPPSIMDNELLSFIYLIVISLILRTALTVFGVPFGALGFEVTTDYTQRTKLQGIKVIMNMGTNMLGPAMAWIIFFPKTEDVQNINNFRAIGIFYSIIILLSVLISVFLTRKLMIDNRDNVIKKKSSFKSFFLQMKQVIGDKYACWVFAFTILVTFGTALHATTQVYIYQYYMDFNGALKGCSSGATMLLCLIGGGLAFKFVEHLDKKGTVYISVIISMICSGLLSLLLVFKIITPDNSFSIAIFFILNSLFWFGFGMITPVAISMIADASEVNAIKTHNLKDGSYMAISTLSNKIALAGAQLVAGLMLSVIGFKSGTQIQSDSTLNLLVLNGYLFAPLIMLLSALLIKFYPLTKEKLNQLREQKEI